MKRSTSILTILLMTISLVLMVPAVASIVDIGMNLPDFIVGIGGCSTAVMVLTGVALPTSATGYNDGEEHMGGNGVVAYIALMSEIATWPSEDSSPSTLDETVLLSGNFAMVAGKYFIKVLVPPNTLTDDSEGQGEPGGRSFKNKGIFKLPGKDATNRGLARRLNNARGVIIIPNDQGYRILYGSETHPVQFMPSGVSGSNAADFRGFEYNWECDSHAPGHTYNGTIPLSGSTLPAIS